MNTKSAPDPTIAPAAVVFGWMATFVWWFVDVCDRSRSLVTDGRGFLDLNGDGAATIRDALLLLWTSWCGATLQPVFYVLEALEATVPRAVEFFEVGAALQALGLANAILGLGAWLAILLGMAKLEMRVRGAFAPKPDLAHNLRRTSA